MSATYIEAQRIVETLKMKKVSSFLYSSEYHNTDLLVTGIGSVATVFAMMSQRNISMYDLFINIGIAGSFSSENKIGTLVNVKSDCFGDIGINSKKGFMPVFESKFNSAYGNLINNGTLYNTSDFPPFFREIKNCSGVTVSEPEKKEYPQIDVETMEGAAFMLVSKHYKKMFLQIRGISNIIGQTLKEDWDINTPIKNYSNLVIDFVKRM